MTRPAQLRRMGGVQAVGELVRSSSACDELGALFSSLGPQRLF